MEWFVSMTTYRPVAYPPNAELIEKFATAQRGLLKDIGRETVRALLSGTSELFPPWSVSDSNPSMYPAWMGLLSSKSFGINRKNYIVSIVVSILVGSPHSEEIRRETNRKRVISVFETSPLGICGMCPLSPVFITFFIKSATKQTARIRRSTETNQK